MGSHAPSAPDAAAAIDIVHAKSLRFFSDLVAELGGDSGALLQQVAIDPQTLANARGAIGYRQLVQLLELAAAQLDCPDFGLRLAALQRGGMYGPLGAAMRNSRTFGEALDYVLSHTYAHTPAARIWLREFPAEQSVLVGHEILLDRVPVRSQSMEVLMLAGHLAARELTGGRARARRVHLRHQPLMPASAYRRYFDCEVRFGQNEDGVFFFQRDLACPIVDSDAQTYRDAIAHIEGALARHRAPLHAQVRGVVMQYMGTEHCTNEAVAAELKLHPRTLHRRLGAEGTSFHRIKDEVRRDLAAYYLQQTGLDFGRISEKLGFSEQSVMTRRCNLWFAASPTTVRSRAIRPPAPPRSRR